MMGTKMRHFSARPNLSLEELLPKDNFYRRLDAMLDLTFADLRASTTGPDATPMRPGEGKTQRDQASEPSRAA